ncbi:CoxG family protein [Sinisalibacter lacisalsi]|uniref:Carbon monoxide dehydrogenase n=1 Tax=Sinisalibacter lacisalsi TaxID=1526570 RepID=A0ABQ1QYI5_9RHOB|nr:carbon monoxide dehydrogenase subunit G [Sinisalibacter lacisalsi]GGD47694.1 carbon monoxide dehydrogenase [Sinisalibacter lacisalsi]
MQFAGENLVPATPERVWDGLNDPDILRRSIPGCTAMERTGESEFTATIVARVGPVSATFKGKVEIVNPEPPLAFTLRGRGQGGPAGFAKGEARIALSPEGDQTRLRYEADVEIGGKLASVGSRLIQGVARKMADDFFARFADALMGTGAQATEGPPPLAEQHQGGPSTPSFAARHIPLIDRLAWLGVGVALGVAGALWLLE